MGFDVTCPTCSEVFFIEKESPDETRKSFKEPTKPNSPKKYHQEKTKKTFVVKNWMLYAGYYVVLILIPIIMLVLGAFLGWESIAGVGAIIVVVGVAIGGGLLGLLGIFVYIQITLTAGGHLDESDGAKSIGLSFIQLISLLVTFPIAW